MRPGTANEPEQITALLLLGDENPQLIAEYITRSALFILTVSDVPRGVCAVTDEGNGTLEIQNLAVDPAFQRQGFGRTLLAHVEKAYAGHFSRMRLGTGESPLTLPFYLACGFVVTGREPDYFPRRYPAPIKEGGVLLRDRLLMEKAIGPG